MGAPDHSVGILVGAIIGTLAVLASVALTTFFCLLRRTDRMGKIKTFPSYSSRGRDKTIQTYEFQAANASGGSDRERERERERRERSGEPYARLDDAKKNDKHDKQDKHGGGNHGGHKKDHPSGPNRASSGSKSPAQALEGRLGDIFGSRKVGKSSGNSGGGYGGYGRSSDRKFTSSAKRAMYPGLSIASTQNRTVGDTTDYGDESDYGRDGNGRDGNVGVGSEEGPVRAGSRMGSDPFTAGGRVEEGRDPNPWRDEKRQDHIDLSKRSGSPPNTHSTNVAAYITNSNANSSSNANSNSRGYGYNTGLGAIPESSGSGYGNDAGSQISNTHSLHSNSQSVVSGTIPLLGKSGGDGRLGHHTSQSAGAATMASMGIGAMPIISRPSTATGATGYHLPTGLTKPIHQARPSDPISVGGITSTNHATNVGLRMDNINPNPHPSTRLRGGNEDDSLTELVDANITDDEEEAPRVRDDVIRLGDGARRDMRSERSAGSDRAPGTPAETKTIETTATNRTGYTDRTNQTNQTNRSRPSNHTHPSHHTNGTNGTNGTTGTHQSEGSEFEPPWAKSMHPYAKAQSPHLPTRELDNLDSMANRFSQHDPNPQNQYGQLGTSQGLDLANLGITLSHPYSNPLVTATAATSTSYPPPSSYNPTSPTSAARSTSRERNGDSFDEPRLHPYGQAMYARSVDDDDVASNSTHTHPQSHSVHPQPMAMGLGFEHPPFYDDPTRNGSGSLSSQRERGGSARLKRPR